MKIVGTILILFALVVGIVPQFTDCQSQGRAIELANGKTIAMKCHWSARAELGLAAPLLILGVLTLMNRRKEILRSLAVLGAAMGVVIALVPTLLIGVCTGMEMMCNSVMRPTLLLTGILTATVCVGLFAWSMRKSPGDVVPPQMGQPA